MYFWKHKIKFCYWIQTFFSFKLWDDILINYKITYLRLNKPKFCVYITALSTHTSRLHGYLPWYSQQQAGSYPSAFERSRRSRQRWPPCTNWSRRLARVSAREEPWPPPASRSHSRPSWWPPRSRKVLAWTSLPCTCLDSRFRSSGRPLEGPRQKSCFLNIQ